MDYLKTGISLASLFGGNPIPAATQFAGGMLDQKQPEPDMGGGMLDLESGIVNALKGLGGFQPQQGQQTPIAPPTPSPYLDANYQYAPPSPINPIPPLFGQQEKGVSLYGGIV